MDVRETLKLQERISGGASGRKEEFLPSAAALQEESDPISEDMDALKAAAAFEEEKLLSDAAFSAFSGQVRDAQSAVITSADAARMDSCENKTSDADTKLQETAKNIQNRNKMIVEMKPQMGGNEQRSRLSTKIMKKQAVTAAREELST